MTKRSPRRLPDPKTFDELTQRYSAYMDEVFERLVLVCDIVKHLESDSPRNNSSVFDFEMICLQLRKSIEAFSLGILLAHRLIDRGFSKKKEKLYKADDVVSELRKLNEEFFPKATMKGDFEEGAFKILDLDEYNGIAPARMEEIMDIYTKELSNQLHAHHEFELHLSDELKQKASDYRDFCWQFLSLIRSHRIMLLGHYVLIGYFEERGAKAVVLQRA